MDKLKYWQIITLGAIATLAATAVVWFLANFLYDALPTELWWVAAVVHIAALMAVFTWVPKPFIDAYWSKRYAEALDRLLSAFSKTLDSNDGEARG